MSLNVEYSFVFEEYVPRIVKNIFIDDGLVDSSILDLGSEYQNLPVETLNSFSQFLVEKFNELIAIVIDKGLDQYEFNMLKQPIENICIMKTGCDDIIRMIEEGDGPKPPK